MGRLAAKAIRYSGEPVILLIAPKPVRNSTPYSIVADNAPDLKAAKRVIIYAIVNTPAVDFQSGEAGIGAQNKATIEADIGYQPLMQQAFAVQTSDGVIWKKTGASSPTLKATYILHVQGWVDQPEF